MKDRKKKEAGRKRCVGEDERVYSFSRYSKESQEMLEQVGQISRWVVKMMELVDVLSRDNGWSGKSAGVSCRVLCTADQTASGGPQTIQVNASTLQLPPLGSPAVSRSPDLAWTESCYLPSQPREEIGSGTPYPP